ncbi:MULTISPECIES: hypothetical protein [unclassified Romboutsia]|uniref:hypothetical protein n=1 Tax=unclassified Romboutsia TaxID=2626894 RepID=UPI0008215DA3|nr:MULTISPECIES: hypothetical protein [unclassified Romboutsia]SCH12711.1 V-type ATP synthase subunit E [uncultured Clostridium sp.]
MKIDLEMIELFDQLEDKIRNAQTARFSQKSVIDKEELLSMIKEIRALMPDEVTQAVWINKERNRILNEAKRDANELKAQAERDAEKIKEEYERTLEELKKNSEETLQDYIESSDIVGQAEQRAKEISERAENIAREIRQGSIDYATDVLSAVEHNLKSILEEIVRDKAELR